MKALALVDTDDEPIYMLAGMEVWSPNTKEELKQKFQQAVINPQLGLLVISTKYTKDLQEELDQYRLSRNNIQILEVPSSKSDSHPGEKSIKYVREIIGQN